MENERKSIKDKRKKGRSLKKNKININKAVKIAVFIVVGVTMILAIKNFAEKHFLKLKKEREVATEEKLELNKVFNSEDEKLKDGYITSNISEVVEDKKYGNYFKNELVLTGATQTIVDEITKEDDARIVTAIPKMNYYIIKFNSDKSLEDLEGLIKKYTEKYEFIVAELNIQK